VSSTVAPASSSALLGRIRPVPDNEKSKAPRLCADRSAAPRVPDSLAFSSPISRTERPREEHASWSGAGLAPCHYQAGDCVRADRPAEPLVEGLIFGGESVALSA